MVRHIVVCGIVETVGVIIERFGTRGRTRAPGGGEEVKIWRHFCSPFLGMWLRHLCSPFLRIWLRHFCSPLLGMWYRGESAVEVLVLAKNQGKRGVHDNCAALLLHPKFVKPMLHLLLLDWRGRRTTMSLFKTTPP